MEAIARSGRARSIGVSNFLREHLETVLQTATIPPAVNQIEFHPYLQHVVAGEQQQEEQDLVAYCKDKGIAVVAYSPLTAITKCRGGPVDAVYADLAAKYGVGEAEVALRWCLDQGVVVLTTSGSEERLRGYLRKLPGFKLTPKEVERVSEAGRRRHFRQYWGNKFGEEDRR